MMKQFFLLFSIFFLNCSCAQDTLYLPVIGLGHEKFVIEENGHFVYSSYLCGSSFVSFGTSKKTLFGYRFDYDTTMCPKPGVVEVRNESTSDSITLFFFNMVDSTIQPYYNSLSVGGKYLRCDTDFVTIPKSTLKSDLLMIREGSDSLIFKFDTTVSELHIYLAPNGSSYNCGLNDVRKLKKTKLGYLYKFAVYDEDREKPWKKGNKRVVRHYYQLRQKK